MSDYALHFMYIGPLESHKFTGQGSMDILKI